MVESNHELIVCGGCNAKIGAGDLGGLLADLPRISNDALLVGFDHSDDAAVIRLNDNTVLIQTLDFFPPPVSDPYLFGQIAAANALSDVYAMGGVPLCALNIVAFPESDDYGTLKEILRGGAEKVKESGAVLSGGHSIHDAKPKYGLSVSGTAHPDDIWMNNTPQIGDTLFLTKPLGVGLVTAAYSVEEMPQDVFNLAAESMCRLNKYAAEFFHSFTVHACTDITGFGLAGHLLEMVGDDKTAVVYADTIPCIKGAREAASEFLLTAGGQRNRRHAGNLIQFDMQDFALEEILFDPQTSGGLLVAIPVEEAAAVRRAKKTAGLPLWEIGRITTYQDAAIIVKK